MTDRLHDVVIVEAVRTPIGQRDDSLKVVWPDELASHVPREVVRRQFSAARARAVFALAALAIAACVPADPPSTPAPATPVDVSRPAETRTPVPAPAPAPTVSSSPAIAALPAPSPTSTPAQSPVAAVSPSRVRSPTAAPVFTPTVDPSAPLAVTHGVASGDVTDRSAVVWARAGRRAELQVESDTDPLFPRPERRQAEAREESDYTARVRLDGLAADTRHYFRVWFVEAGHGGGSAPSDSVVGSFTTAPAATASRSIGFVFGGDVGGQTYCRHVERGYAIFSAMRALSPDFFLASGDMIYADWDCPEEGPRDWRNIPGDFPKITDPVVDWTDPVQVREVYRQHWRYNRGDPHIQGLLQDTPMYSQWDDHEVIGDFGGSWSYWNHENTNRAGFPNLVAAGRDALFDYSPIDRDPGGEQRIYRSFRWGKHLDLFILDSRSHRSRNDLEDTPENAKTMLGAEQLAWLKDGLRRSTATWKVVASSVCLSIPSGNRQSVFGRDGWSNGTDANFSAATGFERELLDVVRFLDDQDVANVVFVSADVHFAQAIRNELDLNGDGDTVRLYQLVAGPFSARMQDPHELDPTLQPTLLHSSGGAFNFGYVRIQEAADGTAHLLFEVRGEDGRPRAGSYFDEPPR